MRSRCMRAVQALHSADQLQAFLGFNAAHCYRPTGTAVPEEADAALVPAASAMQQQLPSAAMLPAQERDRNKYGVQNVACRTWHADVCSRNRRMTLPHTKTLHP